MPPPKHELRTWTLHHPDDNTTYTISTDPSLLDLAALNDAFASDMLYWAKPMDPSTLRLCLDQSLCFGLYVHGPSPFSYLTYPPPLTRAPLQNQQQPQPRKK